MDLSTTAGSGPTSTTTMQGSLSGTESQDSISQLHTLDLSVANKKSIMNLRLVDQPTVYRLLSNELLATIANKHRSVVVSTSSAQSPRLTGLDGSSVQVPYNGLDEEQTEPVDFSTSTTQALARDVKNEMTSCHAGYGTSTSSSSSSSSASSYAGSLPPMSPPMSPQGCQSPLKEET